jgi:exosortase A-associated hydrolase 2
MTESPFYFPGEGHELFGVFHEPEGERTGETFVFCHPMAEEKLWSHRVLVSFARRLAASGHHVLRFDLMGNGDSDRDFSESSVETGLSDMRSAIDEARRRSLAPRVHLLGLRFGGTLAALAAERATDVDRLILWAPIVDGERYMQELLRTNLATQTAVFKEVRYDRVQLVEQMQQGQTVNVDGYELSHGMYAGAAAIRLSDLAKSHAGQVLIVQIDRQPARPARELQGLTDSYSHATLQAAQEEPFWKEIARSYLSGAPSLFAVTSAWLQGGR